MTRDKQGWGWIVLCVFLGTCILALVRFLRLRIGLWEVEDFQMVFCTGYFA